MAFRPMKWQRCSTFTPGHAVSTMNAVICRFSLPFTTLDGVRAITTSNSALVPLVHHSFSPFRIHAWPSGVGTRSEEHTSELQSLAYLVCRLLLEKKKKKKRKISDETNGNIERN